MKKLEELNLKEVEVLDRSAFMAYSSTSGAGSSGASGSSGSSSSSGTDVNWPGCPDYECHKDSDCKKDEMCLLKKCGWGSMGTTAKCTEMESYEKNCRGKEPGDPCTFFDPNALPDGSALCMAIVPIG